jgi:hypothetical protein
MQGSKGHDQTAELSALLIIQVLSNEFILSVAPAKAGVPVKNIWIPASAGMTPGIGSFVLIQDYQLLDVTLILPLYIQDIYLWTQYLWLKSTNIDLEEFW